MEIKVTVAATFSNQEWGLLESANVADIATKLNYRLCQLINDSDFNKATTRVRMVGMMMANAQYGAYDDNSIEFLDKVLDTIFEFKDQHIDPEVKIGLYSN